LLTHLNGTLYFGVGSGEQQGLWRSDGTAAGTVRVKDVPVSDELTAINGTLFFMGFDYQHGYEPWKSDGTTAGTVLVKDIGVGTVGSYPKGFTGVGGTVYFAADGGEGEELWKTDGTAAGTVLVKDIRKGAFPLGGGPAGSFPRELTELNGRLYFTADNGDSAKNANGRELWTSDGTPKGTRMVKDIFPGKSSSAPAFLTNINGRLYFTATDGVHGVELWQSDGTAAGTVMVKDINPRAASSDPSHLVAMNNTLYFSADDGVHGRELWDPPSVPPSSVTPNDPLLARQWGLHVTQADQAWNLTTGSTTVTVAVTDNGVDYTHPDLYRNIWVNQEEIPAAVRALLQDVDGDGLITFWDLNETVNQGPGRITDLNGTGFIDGGDLLKPISVGGWADGLDNGGNGYIDDLIGWDFFDNDNDPLEMPQFIPDDYHGTAVAGIIGAVTNNAEGIAGVNWQIQIMPVRWYHTTDFAVLFSPEVFPVVLAADIKAGEYAVRNGARVVNFTGTAPTSLVPEQIVTDLTTLLDEAVARDVLFVTTAGSLGVDTAVVPHVPGGMPHDNIINVAATLRNDHLVSLGNSYFPGNNWASNWGPTTVDLAGPGDHVWAPVPQSLPGIPYDARMNGTSSAAPHVTGAAALILSLNPNLSYAQVKSLILDNVDVVPKLVGKTVTGGRLNIYKAVAATPLPLLASSIGAGTTDTLTAVEATPLLTEAVARWQAAGADVSGLTSIDVRVADLGGTTLGMASGNTIWLDVNAAGWGWFVDPTPQDNTEFTTPGNQGEQNRMDLLTVLEHEVGHLLGFEHDASGVMTETLAAGTRPAVGASGDAEISRFAADYLFALLAAEEEAPWMDSRLLGPKRAKR